MPARPLPSPRTSEFRLANGLRVLLAPDPRSPTASVWVWYRVGSKNERPGITGASHWVEHMLFQGSPRYPKGAIDRGVVEVGGTLNAFTSYDFTAYFTTVPREHLRLPLAIEADRLTRAYLRDGEVDRERSVVLSEREGDENWPEFRAEEELYQLAFRHHPYRWDALGYRRDIESMSGAQLRAYYRRFYGPRNATLVVAGGVAAREVRREIVRRFARLPPTGEDPTVGEVEPEPSGERRSDLAGPGTTPFVVYGYRAPGLDDERAAALLMLDAVLGGECRLFSGGSVWGSPKDHPSSRLYRALVDRGLAVRAHSEWEPKIYPSLWTIFAQASDGIPLERLAGAVDRVLDRLSQEGPTEGELREMRIRLRRSARLAYEGASRTGFRVGLFSVLGGAGLGRRLFERLLTVRAKELRRVAGELLGRERRCVVRYEPRARSAA